MIKLLKGTGAFGIPNAGQDAIAIKQLAKFSP